MNNNKGSLILKALSPDADEAQLITYLEKRAKSIPSDKIPDLLRNLPVVLSRNVAEETGLLVVQRLHELGAIALFIPVQGEACQDEPAPQQHNGTTDTTNLIEAGRTSPVPPMKSYRSWQRVNKELCIILSMLAIAWLLNTTIASQYLLLGFYTLPSVLSAYYFGRRQAVFTAFASILLVGLVSYFNPGRFEQFNLAGLGGDSQWYHILSWGCILLVTAYTMGTLYERNKSKMQELRQTYQGLLLILRHFIAQDEERENHCFRVSIYATRIATFMGLEKDDIEDIRSAALLHDLGQLKISRSILHKAASLVRNEPVAVGGPLNEHLLSGPMGRILPMLLGDKTEGELRTGEEGTNIPMGARILAVADAYDTLTVGNASQPGLPPESAKDTIVAGSGTSYDPEVVKAFAAAFNRLEMELPSIIL